MVYIKYLKDGNLITTGESNNDIQIIINDNKPEYIISIKAKSNISLISARLDTEYTLNNKDVYFYNGYQSWTDTHLTYKKYKERNILRRPKSVVKLWALDEYGDSHLYKYSNDIVHGYDLFYAKGTHPVFVYNLNYEKAYLVFELHKKKNELTLLSMVEGWNLKLDETAIIFHFAKFGSYEEGIESFNKRFIIDTKEKIIGYTSWYNYYQNINEEIILRDLDALDSRFNLFQIDDGYETFVGDWLSIDKNKFPNGLEPIVKKIHERGMKAGIWLAPFVGEKKSELFNSHPDWFKKNSKGNFVKCGGNWSGFYALDLKKPEVIDYIKRSLTFYLDMGFDFFKLDFLYASARSIYPGETRAMSQRRGYALLREILGDKLILGCGAQQFSSYKLFDYMRVGPDVSLDFDDKPYMRQLHRERPSTKVTVKNTVFRSIFNNHLFLNDPDVFILREENNTLTFDQRKALVTLDALFGSVLMTSDDLKTYGEKENKVLDDAFNLFYNSRVYSFDVRKNEIKVQYTLEGKTKLLVYNTEKGVIVSGG